MLSETEELMAVFEAIQSLEAANLGDNQPHDDILAHAKYMHEKVIPAMEAARETADKLEKVVADDLWPLPKYSEILHQEAGAAPARTGSRRPTI